MHAAKINAEKYANDKNTQVNTTRRAHPPNASCAYQQLSGVAHLFAARVPSAHRLHPGRTYQPAYNR